MSPSARHAGIARYYANSNIGMNGEATLQKILISTGRLGGRSAERAIMNELRTACPTHILNGSLIGDALRRTAVRIEQAKAKYSISSRLKAREVAGRPTGAGGPQLCVFGR
jgi:hypothetical protein